MRIEEIRHFLGTKEGKDLYLQAYFDQEEPITYIDPVNWLKLGGESGKDVTLDKIPSFLKKEKARLDSQYQRYLKDSNIPQRFFINLIVDLAILQAAEDFDSPFGKAAAERYFLRRYATEWYKFTYDPSLAMGDHNKQPFSANSSSWIIFHSSLNALQLL